MQEVKKSQVVGAGVERDIYSSAWKEILDGLCIGERERVPIVHNLYINEGNYIAKILVKGFMNTKNIFHCDFAKPLLFMFYLER